METIYLTHPLPEKQKNKRFENPIIGKWELLDNFTVFPNDSIEVNTTKITLKVNNQITFYECGEYVCTPFFEDVNGKTSIAENDDLIISSWIHKEDKYYELNHIFLDSTKIYTEKLDEVMFPEKNMMLISKYDSLGYKEYTAIYKRIL